MKYYQKLKLLLKKANAPLTGKKVACLIETQNSIFGGFNDERSIKDILHAETEAFKQVPKGSFVKTIHLLSGKHIKYSIPCEDCVKKLSSKTTTKTKFVLYNSLENGKSYSQFFDKVRQTYNPFKKINFVRYENFKQDLKSFSLVNYSDMNLLFEIVSSIKKYNKENQDKMALVYMTGSACGVSPRYLFAKQIIKKPYVDLDLIFIFPKKYPENPNKFIKDIYKKSIRNLKINSSHIKTKNKPSYILEETGIKQNNRNFLFRKEYIPQSEKISAIDVSVGKKLESVMTIKYLKKNWLIKLI